MTAAAIAFLISTTKLPGEEKTPAGVRRNSSLYVKMRDGVQIAADVWLPQDYQSGQRLPVLLRTTRYGRDGQFGWAFRLLVALKETDPHGPGDAQTDYLNGRNFIVVVADARGTGASGGHREIEFSREEVSDLGELANWAAQQSWSNGRIGTFGGSYEGTAAELAAATRAPAVKAVAATSSQFDTGVQIFPGGIFNQSMVRAWSDLIRKLDGSGDVCVTENLGGLHCWWAGRMVRGVKRVDDDRDATQLAAMLAQRHNKYPDELLSRTELRDDPISLPDGSSYTLSEISPVGHRAEIEQSHVAMQIWCGWLDGTACEGALSRYLTFKNPQQVIIGSFSHTLEFNIDPFETKNRHSPPDPTVQEQNRMMADFFDPLLRTDTTRSENRICYFTMGERQWHETRTWPPPGFDTRTKFYFAGEHALSTASPVVPTASDNYAVNFTASTGEDNRWSAVMGRDVFYPDRPVQDAMLLVYTGSPLTTDLEISGSPVVALAVSSSAADGAFIAYLEDVAPDGRVTLLDEGELRGVCCKQADASSSSRNRSLPLTPGKPAELKFSMWPMSVLLRKEHRIRIALAGADTSSFRRYPATGDVTWTVYRESNRGSYLELPLRAR
ncbi:MAG TPA: CocE/NonD family hydrolase [Candidatus Dormibacteraeota bacterium]|nr:CocE/NonD family hydrolase [Candidatus Dormibacteraeota bacterium]